MSRTFVLLLIFVNCGSSSFNDVSPSVGVSDIKGIIAAFGDFNGDKHTDLFVITGKQGEWRFCIIFHYSWKIHSFCTEPNSKFLSFGDQYSAEFFSHALICGNLLLNTHRTYILVEMNLDKLQRNGTEEVVAINRNLFDVTRPMISTKTVYLPLG